LNACAPLMSSILSASPTIDQAQIATPNTN
jgi:hypothetical protein